MNREILFRGKRLDNGRWVYGNLIINKECQAHRIVDGFGLTGDMRNGDNICFGDFYLVDPATVGQFTGLLDKNGNRVFEGDIFTADEYPFVDEGKPNYYGVVEWIFAGFQYVLKLANTDIHGISDGVNEILEDAGWVEVIGNIHNKPELIK